MSKLAYKTSEPELAGGGTRVPDGTGVLGTLERSLDDDDDDGSKIVVVLVSGGSGDTKKVVVEAGSVTVVGGRRPGRGRLDEYMRL